MFTHGTGLRIVLLATGLVFLTSASVPPLGKVMIIIFENADYSEVVTQPNFASLRRSGATLDQFFAETHPSQPNYIALTAGDTFHLNTDADVTVDTRHVGNLLEDKGKTWKVYAEDYPGKCFLGGQKGNFVRKHVPFLSFKNVQENPAECEHIVNASELERDIQGDALPDVSFYIPNLKNDGHDTGVDYAGKWFEKTFGPRLRDPGFMKNLLLIATFDEGDNSVTNQIYTVLFGNHVRAGAASGQRHSHYSLLKTIEAGFGLDGLGHHDTEAKVIDDIWAE